MISLVSTSKLRHLNVARYSYIASSKLSQSNRYYVSWGRANGQQKSCSIVVSSKFLEACATPNCDVARYIIQRYFMLQSSELRLGSAYLQPRSRDPLALSSSCPPRAKRVATLFLKVAETLTPNVAFNSKVALASMECYYHNESSPLILYWTHCDSRVEST